jgi:beta-lactamase regulating signal transducer with metallopeptidase domain
MLFDAVLSNAVIATVLAVVVALAERARFLRRRPAVTHLLWFAVLLKLAIPPLVPLPLLPSATANSQTKTLLQRVVHQADPVESANAIQAVTAATAPAAVAPAEPWQPDLPATLLILSFVGTLVFLARCAWQSVRLTRLLRTAEPAPARFVALLADVAARLDVTPPPGIYIINACISPALSPGRRRAAIIVPRRLTEELDDEQLACIFSHELAHLLRHDRAFNVAGLAVVALFWWHPVGWWSFRQMRARQEECCDALAISRIARSRRVYAQTLLKALDFLQGRREWELLASPGFGHRTYILRRFEMIANMSVRPTCSQGAVAFLALCALSFVCFPARADNLGKNPSADSAQESKQTLPQSLDTRDGYTNMRQSIRNLKRLGVALHDWADAHEITPGKTDNLADPKSALNSPFRRFPPAVIYGKDGKGKYPHSWRIELLPYLKAKNVYDEYQFDEPWDSPANKQLLEKMPEVFRNPADDSVNDNSAYFVLVGKLVDETVNGPALQTLFSSKAGVSFRQMTDGTSNILAMVEAKRDIPWTKPDDIPYDPAGKLPQMGGYFKEGFCVNFGDAHCQFVFTPIKDSDLRALISPATGDVSNHKFRRLGF